MRAGIWQTIAMRTSCRWHFTDFDHFINNADEIFKLKFQLSILREEIRQYLLEAIRHSYSCVS